MKLKYRNITVPYRVYSKKDNYTYYIYNDKKYSKLSDLFNDFLGIYLTYHYEVNDKVKEVHNLSEVIEDVIKNKDTFKIPTKYKEEYSQEEYKYITKLKKDLLDDKLKIEYIAPRDFTLTLKDIFNHKLYNFNKMIYDKYKKVSIPKKIHSKEYDNDYYVVAGNYYEDIYSALDEVFNAELYYQFGGTKNQNNRSHLHSHSFDDLISMVFDYSAKFKIHVFQREFYSAQELEVLGKLSEKLRKIKFHSVEQTADLISLEEYFYLKDNKKYISLIFHNIKYQASLRKYEKEKLKAHKI